ncbi:MAG: hypothetical protein IPK18_06930 [Sphingobacteriales bacterium]|jgi:alpha-tubulin suppressor-like RCC1 family protein|nr:MAG: hypothetical protein IPK18_06930 [Sphingobacteriales bacterium]
MLCIILATACRKEKNTTKIAAIDAGDEYSLILRADNTLWACGYNNNGQLGDSTNTDKN